MKSQQQLKFSKESAHACFYLCLALLANMGDSITTMVATWRAYDNDSKYFAAFMVFFLLYHAFSGASFGVYMWYLWKCRRSDVPLEDKETIGCFALIYSPICANVKFLGHGISFLLIALDEWNYSGFIYQGANSLFEALCSSLPLIIIQCLMINEEIGTESPMFAEYIQSLIFSSLSFIVNLPAGLYLLKRGLGIRKDAVHIRSKL